MFGIDDIISAALKIVDKIIPDPAQKAAAALQIAQLKQAGDFKEIETELASMQMQADVNKVEAASTSIFVAGWRPYVGWVCGSGLAYDLVARPLLTGLFEALHWVSKFPTLDTPTIIGLLTGMLGFGGMRTFEKSKGIDTKNL